MYQTNIALRCNVGPARAFLGKAEKTLLDFANLANPKVPLSGIFSRIWVMRARMTKKTTLSYVWLNRFRPCIAAIAGQVTHWPLPAIAQQTLARMAYLENHTSVCVLLAWGLFYRDRREKLNLAHPCENFVE